MPKQLEVLKEKSRKALEDMNQAYDACHTFIDKAYLEDGGRNPEYWNGENLKDAHKVQWTRLVDDFKTKRQEWFKASDASLLAELVG